MALTRTARALLKKRSLPSTEDAQRIVRDYVARTGLSMQIYAHRVGYSPTTLNYWFNGQYSRVSKDDRALIASQLDYIEANPIVPEADISGQLHETGNVRRLRESFYLALDRARIVVLHGNPGTQKSFVSRYLIADLNRVDAAKNGHGRRAYYVYCRQGMTPFQLMKRIARACGVPGGCTIDDTINNLRHDFRGRRVVLLLDESQHLDTACLETIRELNDEAPHFGLLLLGSHDLREKFEGFSMEQWRSRLDILDSLPGISREEARAIVARELPYLKDASVEKFLSQAVVKDRGALVKEAHVHQVDKAEPYISARDLFWNIRNTQEARARREVSA